MSDDARAGRPAAQLLLAIGAAVGIAGLGIWSIIGSDPAAPEGSLGAKQPSRVTPVAGPPSVELAPIASQALAGGPVLLRVRALEGALPAGVAIKVEGVDPSTLSVSAGFQVRGDRIEPAPDLKLAADGTALLAVHSTSTGAATLRVQQDDRAGPAHEIAWTVAPDDFVLLLPGQSLEDGKVTGAPADVRAGESFEVTIVPVREGREASFAGAYQGTLTLAAAAPRTITVTGARTTVAVVASANADDARVEVQGLHTGGVFRSATFRVLAGEGS